MSASPGLSLKQRVRQLVTTISLIGGTLTLLLFYLIGNATMEKHGRQTATMLADKTAEHIRTPIRRELALARKLSDSPLLKKWALQDRDPDLIHQALEELQSYARHFRDGSVFFIAAPSRRYYYFDDATPPTADPKYTLDPNSLQDIWYFNTMRRVGRDALNVNYDAVLNTTKVWINVIVHNNGHKVGLAGTGLDLGFFLNEVVDTGTPGVSAILFDREGKIQAHQNPDRVAINAKRAGNPIRGTMPDLLEDGVWTTMQESMDQGRLAPGEPILLAGPRFSPAKPISALVYLPELDWYALVRVDTGALLNWTDFAPLAVLLIGSVLIMLAALTWMMNRVVLSPLALLTASTRQIASGRYEPVAVTSHDEIGALGTSFNDMVATVRGHTENLESLIQERTAALEASRNALQARNSEIMDSIEYALTIQQTILPPEELLSDALEDHFLIWRPRDLVGGDFYAFQTTDQGWLLGVIDCTGHGIPGAFMSMAAHAALQHALATVSPTDPGRVMAAMNRIIRTSLHRDGNNLAQDSGLDMALCHYFRDTGTLCFAGARMDLFIDEEGRSRRIRGTGHSIGYRRSNPDAAFANHHIPAREETTFYLLTDGITDQAGGEKGFGFGRRRLLETIREYGDLPLLEQRQKLLDRIAAHQGSHPQRDDITMIGFRVGNAERTDTATPPRRSS